MTGIVINIVNCSLDGINLVILVILQFMLGVYAGNFLLQTVNTVLCGSYVSVAVGKVILCQSSTDVIQPILLLLDLCSIVVVQSFLSFHLRYITCHDKIDFIVGGIDYSNPLTFSCS